MLSSAIERSQELMATKQLSDQQRQQHQSAAAATAAALALSQFSNLNNLSALAEAIQKQAREFSRRHHASQADFLWPATTAAAATTTTTNGHQQTTSTLSNTTRVDFSSTRSPNDSRPSGVALGPPLGLLDFSLQPQRLNNEQQPPASLQLNQQPQSGSMSNNNNHNQVPHNQLTPASINRHLSGLALARSGRPESLGPAARLNGASGGARRRRGARKCRKTYGMARRELWCTQCKWKKACSRFSLQLASNGFGHHNHHNHHHHNHHHHHHHNDNLVAASTLAGINFQQALLAGDTNDNSTNQATTHRNPASSNAPSFRHHQFHILAANCLAITSQQAALGSPPSSLSSIITRTTTTITNQQSISSAVAAETDEKDTKH